MFEYKIHTQRDKTFSDAFDPTGFEAALKAPTPSDFFPFLERIQPSSARAGVDRQLAAGSAQCQRIGGCSTHDPTNFRYSVGHE